MGKKQCKINSFDFSLHFNLDKNFNKIHAADDATELNYVQV